MKVYLQFVTLGLMFPCHLSKESKLSIRRHRMSVCFILLCNFILFLRLPDENKWDTVTLLVLELCFKGPVFYLFSDISFQTQVVQPRMINYPKNSIGL